MRGPLVPYIDVTYTELMEMEIAEFAWMAKSLKELQKAAKANTPSPPS